MDSIRIDDLELDIREHTKLAGEDYILALDANDPDTAYILRQVGDEDEDVIYEFVDDDNTLKALTKLFEELSDDISFELEDDEEE